jgi:large repetitive protein
MGAAYTGSGRIDTQGYSAKDYLVVLRASIAGVEETIAGTYFRVEGAPSAPALAGPLSGADVETFTPALSVSNAADPNDDKLIYEFELYADSSMLSLLTAGTVPETAGITAWTVPTPLPENQTCYWRARAYDGKLYGPWLAPAAFRVNTADDPPSAPTIASPADGTAVAVFTPILTINNASDPDSVSLTYNFDVALDPDFTQILGSVKGVTSGPGATSWTVPVSLQENKTYYWRAQADDWLMEGPWSVVSSFFVNTVNDAPSAPTITTPAANGTVMTLSTDIAVANSTDPDSSGLFYFFETDTAITFDSPDVIRSGSVAEVSGTTAWHVAGLKDNTRYYLRVKASDGIADSPWSSVISFFANTANDPPTTPILANPSSGAGVNQFTPTLSVHNATDPDFDPLTYEFEAYADAAKTNLIAHAAGIAETGEITSWTVPVQLAENQTCYWQARAFDGALNSAWMPMASFMVNTANDAPGAPKLSSPAEGSSIATLMPTLAVANAVDPDSSTLTYGFEIFSGSAPVVAANDVPQDNSGITAITLGTSLSDNTLYQWRARAYDGDSYGPWTNMANFSVHLPKTAIGATINFDPDTLNKKSKGNWVTVYIELPAGYKPADIDISSLRLEGAIPAEPRPYALGDCDKDGIPDLMVKFNRNDLISLLPNGDSVPVHLSGKVGSITFEGVDVIRVIP